MSYWKRGLLLIGAALAPLPVSAQLLYLATGGPTARIEAYDANGTLAATFPTTAGFIRGLEVANNGDIVFTGAIGDTNIYRFNSSGSRIPPYLNVNGVFSGGLDFDSSGRLYAGVSGDEPMKVERFDVDGTPMGVFATLPQRGSRAAFGLEFDSHDNLYAINYDTIDRFDSSGSYLGVAAALPGVLVPDFAIDDQDYLYVVGIGKLEVFDSSAQHIRTIHTGTGSLYTVAIDDHDIIYAGGAIYPGGAKQGFVRMFRTDGTPLGSFVANVDGETDEIALGNGFSYLLAVPEPSTATLCGLAAAITLVCKSQRRDSRAGFA